MRERALALMARLKKPAAVGSAVLILGATYEGSIPRGVFDVTLKFCQVVVMGAPIVNGLSRASADTLDGSVPDSGADASGDR